MREPFTGSRIVLMGGKSSCYKPTAAKDRDSARLPLQKAILANKGLRILNSNVRYDRSGAA